MFLLKQDAVDVDISALEVRTRLDQILGKIQTSFAEGVMSDVAFPKAEDFGDQIQFEKLH